MTDDKLVRDVAKAICCPEGCVKANPKQVYLTSVCEALGYSHQARAAIAVVKAPAETDSATTRALTLGEAIDAIEDRGVCGSGPGRANCKELVEALCDAPPSAHPAETENARLRKFTQGFVAWYERVEQPNGDDFLNATGWDDLEALYVTLLPDDHDPELLAADDERAALSAPDAGATKDET